MPIVTDGSLQDRNCGAAVVFDPTTPQERTVRISITQPSIFLAESVALHHAVQYASLRPDPAYILCDSLSLLQQLRRGMCSNYFVYLTARILAHSSHIHVYWIPGHIHLPCHDRADEEAKIAANQDCAELEVPWDAGVIRQSYRHEINYSWEQQLIRSVHAYQDPKMVLRNPGLRYKNRPTMSLISRLRIGLFIDAIYANKYLGRPTRNCPFCFFRDGSLHHYLTNCTALDSWRHRLLDSFATLSSRYQGRLYDLIYEFLPVAHSHFAFFNTLSRAEREKGLQRSVIP
jgi:ribonuclease HI